MIVYQIYTSIQYIKYKYNKHNIYSYDLYLLIYRLV